MLLNVKEIYDYNREHSYKMLSAFTSSDQEVDFWKEYKDNYNYFDRLFMKTYKSFIAFNAEGEQIDEISDDFRSDVYSWLMANDKRYSELYRVQLVSDEDDPITFNYDLHETYSGTESKSVASSEGARSDSETKSKSYGAASDSSAVTETKGAHTDTIEHDNQYGARTDSVERDNVYGAQSNSGSKTLTYDDYSVEVENKVSAFNDGTYTPKEFTKTDTGERQDGETSSETIGTHTDSLDDTLKYGAHKDDLDDTYRYGAQTNGRTENITKGAHTDGETNSYTKGAQSNTSSQTGTDGHTMRRYGNIGVQTTSDILSGHISLWQAYSFYKIIFDDIANEFLRV